MRLRKRMISALLLIFAILFFIVITVPTQKALVFYEEHTSEIAAYLPLQKDTTFQIIFVHSIHLTDVVEKYEITNDNQIKQYEMVFEEFGIGMPSVVGDNEEFVYEDGKYHIKSMDNIFPSLNIRNGKTVSKHRLVWHDNEKHVVYFNDYFTPGDWFTVKVDTLTLLQTWNEVKIRD